MHLPTPGHLSSTLAVFQGLRAMKGQAFLALDGPPERQAGAASGPFVLSIKPLLLEALRIPQDAVEGVLAPELGDLSSSLGSTTASLCERGKVTHPL